MEKFILNNQVEIPALGFGVFQIPDPKEAEQAVLDALSVGYRLIDTAASYNNEPAVGKAIKKSGIPREEIFVTTKLWLKDTSYEGARAAFKKSLANLELEYIDLYLIHLPFNDIYGAWRAMEEFYELGEIKAIGVSNFTPDRLVDLTMNNRINPAVNQIAIHPFRQQKASKRTADEYNIQLEAWGPLAQGNEHLFDNEILLGIAKKYNKTVAQVVLRWHIQNGIIAIPKTVHKKRMEENFSIFDFSLSEKDKIQISKLDDTLNQVDRITDPEVVKNLNKLVR